MPEQDNLSKKDILPRRRRKTSSFLDSANASRQKRLSRNSQQIDSPPSPEEIKAAKKAQEIAEVTGHLARNYPDIFISNPKREQLFKETLIHLFPGLKEREIDERLKVIMRRESLGLRSLSVDEERKILYSDNPQEAWEAIDEALSKIYATADMNPEEHFNASLTLDDQIKIAAIRMAAQESKHSHYLVPRFNTVHSMRTVIHNVMYVVEGGHGKIEDAMKIMQVNSNISDVVFGTEGVATAHRLYEDYLEKIRLQNLRSAKQENWIAAEDIYYHWKEGKSKLDVEVRNAFKRAITAGLLDGRKYKPEEIDQKSGPWPEWKINRALHLGRAYGSATGRFAELVSTVRLPKGKEMVSPYLEDFVRTFNPIEHLARKFKVGNQMAYLIYLFTGRMQEFRDQNHMNEVFDEVTDRRVIMRQSKKERDRIPNYIWNLTGIDTRTGGWRLGTAAAENPLFERDKAKYLGIEKNLRDTREKFGVWKKGSELQEVLRHNQEMWDFTLQRAPLVVLRGLLPVFPELQYEINRRVFGPSWGIKDKNTGNLVALPEISKKN
jgi:hypothetical protein